MTMSDQIADVLSEHYSFWGVEEGAECECGEIVAPMGEYAVDKHRQHQADALLPLIRQAVNTARQEGWDEVAHLAAHADNLEAGT